LRSEYESYGLRLDKDQIKYKKYQDQDLMTENKRRKSSSAVLLTKNKRLDLVGLHSVKAYLTTRTADEMYSLYKTKKLVIPKFQRKPGVWKKNQNQDLIITMIRGYPIVPLLIQEDKGKFWLLDGQQRLVNEMNFKNNQIKILKKFDPILGGMSWEDLEPETRKRYNTYPIPMLVVVGGNGVGVQSYIKANSGIPINKAEKRRGRFYNTAFYKLVNKVSKTLLPFYVENKIISENDIIRSKEEEIIAENLILSMREATDGSDLDDIYEKWRTAKKMNQYITKDPVKFIQRYFDMIKTLFPNGLKGTGFDNSNNFYGLLGAIKVVDHIGMLPNGSNERKAIGDKLAKFIREVKLYSKTNIGSDSVKKYHKTIVRGTRDLKNREDRIEILVQVIER
jgi:hypothetical protein